MWWKNEPLTLIAIWRWKVCGEKNSEFCSSRYFCNEQKMFRVRAFSGKRSQTFLHCSPESAVHSMQCDPRCELGQCQLSSSKAALNSLHNRRENRQYLFHLEQVFHDRIIFCLHWALRPSHPCRQLLSVLPFPGMWYPSLLNQFLIGWHWSRGYHS